MSAEKIKLSICADDYGITDKVSEAIVNLISFDRITETSCMVTRPNIKNGINSLLAHKNKKVCFQIPFTGANTYEVILIKKRMLSVLKNLFFSILKKNISKNLINDEIKLVLMNLKIFFIKTMKICEKLNKTLIQIVV